MSIVYSQVVNIQLRKGSEKKLQDFDKEFFADLLRHAQGDRSLNKFAADCGISSAHLSRLTRQKLDTAPSPETLRKIADCAQVKVSYVDLLIACGHLSPHEQMPDTPHLNNEEQTSPVDPFVSVPVLGTIKAGYDLFSEKQILSYEIVPKQWVQDGEYFFFSVIGNSMIDDGIKDGYRVLVRRQNYVEDGKVAVVIVNGDEGTLKRIFHQSKDLVLLVASNSTIPPRALKPKEILIQGQVVKVEFDL